MGQWNRTENPETDPCIYGQLLFKRMAKVILWGKTAWIQLDIYLEKNEPQCWLYIAHKN